MLGWHYFSYQASRDGLDPQVLPILWSRKATPGPLLPNVQHLSLHVSHYAGHALYPRLVIGGALTSVIIDAPEEYFGHASHSALDNLPPVLGPASRTIRNFIIKSDGAVRSDGTVSSHSFGAMPELSNLVRGFEHLETLQMRCGYLSDNISHLSTLANLRSMDISLRPGGDFDLLGRKPLQQGFSNMRTARLELPSLEMVSLLLQSYSFDQLQSLTIERSDQDGPCDLNLFFRSLQASRPPLSLESLHLLANYKGTWPPAQSSSPIPANTLDPLYSFTNLHTVIIDIDPVINLVPTTLLRMSSAWPNLRVLGLPERSMRRRPNITLSDLLSFVSSCPHLQDLGLLVDAYLPIPPFVQQGEIKPCHSLRHLDVYLSPAREAADIAAFLTLAFPGLTRFSSGAGHEGMRMQAENHVLCWKLVGQLMAPIVETISFPGPVWSL